jgi:hypothetical protein
MREWQLPGEDQADLEFPMTFLEISTRSGI